MTALCGGGGRVCTLTPQGGAAGCPAPVADVAALMGVFSAAGGAGWARAEGWGGSGSYCGWFGVSCDAAFNVRVAGLCVGRRD